MKILDQVPASAKSVIMVMTLCSPVVMIAGATQPEMMKWYFGGYAVLCVIAGLGAFLVDRRNKKKANSFSSDIKDNAGGTQGVRDPDKLREIDDLRQQFQRGIDTYKQYGKDLYSLPWFVLVGEAGSGKTEALRRSEIGFPDKLQDYWQGTGGTLSMHWWFTNRAVILDTAGRLFVRDGAASQEGPLAQWTSFLQMLRKNRPDCPINGLVLVIPATSLIPMEDASAEADSVKEIDSKAGQIAKQMEVLQTELGVRFPVYVLITKTDRIVGFREFFEHIESAEERYQMLGWSNPDALDRKFDPVGVTGFLRQTADRLRRRRMALMKDPVPAPGRKRFDEVDSMFAFPDSFEKLAPKLERYLRHIFAVDEWSARPPFLRGIYFTSALQQGAVLDEALARAVGLSVQEYERQGGDEDLSLAKNRSYFLRDFFLEKVFQEKGLITRTGKKVGGISGWKLWVPLGFCTALLLLGIAGWITGRKPPAELQAWQFLTEDAYSTAHGGFYPLVTRTPEGTWELTEKPVTARSLLSQLDQLGGRHLKERPKLGWLFSPAVALDGGVKRDRHQSYRIAVDKIVVTPLAEAAIDGLSKRSDRWSAEGMSPLDADVIEELLLWYAPQKLEEGEEARERDPDSTVATLMRSAGLPYSSSKNRDLHVKTIAPLVASLRAAYPDGALSSELINPRDREKLAEVIDRLFKGGDANFLLPRLEAFDAAWGGLTAAGPGLTFGDAQSMVRKLSAAAGELRDSEPQIEFLVSGLGGEKPAPEEGGGDELKQPAVFGKNLVEEFPEALRKAGGSRFNRWLDLAEKPAESGEVSKRRDELAKLHAQKLPDGSARNYAARATLCEEILTLDASVPEKIDLPSAEGVGKSIAALKERAKGLGMEATGDLLVAAWAQHFIGNRLKDYLGFPLVFDQVVGGEERVLSRDQAAATMVLLQHLSGCSDKARTTLAPFRQVAGAIFDADKLSKGDVVVNVWEVSLDQGDNSIWFGVVSEIGINVSRPQSVLRWDSTTGAEGKLIGADTGAELYYLDTNQPPARHAFGNGNHDQWAPVRWAVATISRTGSGATTSFAGKRISLIVKLPPSFPTVLDELPVSRNLSN